MTEPEKQFLDQASAEALKAEHPFPKMAACEAALESGWGHSQLAREGNNLFGMKIHAHADSVFGTMSLPTREFLNSAWTVVQAQWIKYPDWKSCFCDRLATLERLANVYPHYKAALAATDPHTYIVEVSKTWSTDPNRAMDVEGVYQEYTQGVTTHGV